LDESETETIANSKKMPAPVTVDAEAVPQPKVNPFKTKYDSTAEIAAVLEEAQDVKDIANLYYINAELVEAHPELKKEFTSRKDQFYNNSTISA
jgi:hypothetical protein